MMVWEPDPREWSPRGYIPGEPISPEFVDAYLEAALWSTLDDHGIPFDKDFSIKDFSDKAVQKAVDDSNSFIKKNKKDLKASGGNMEQHGHDFWLTRNGHGAGFWDRGYGKVGYRLTDAAHKYGELNIEKDAHGELHFW